MPPILCLQGVWAGGSSSVGRSCLSAVWWCLLLACLHHHSRSCFWAYHTNSCTFGIAHGWKANKIGRRANVDDSAPVARRFRGKTGWGLCWWSNWVGRSHYYRGALHKVGGHIHKVVERKILWVFAWEVVGACVALAWKRGGTAKGNFFWNERAITPGRLCRRLIWYSGAICGFRGGV